MRKTIDPVVRDRDVPLVRAQRWEHSSLTAGLDPAGNLTAKPGLSSIGYTAADQVASVTKGGVAYTYKHAGADQNELLWQTTPAGSYSYAYGRNDAQGRPTIETVTKDGQTANVINDPVTGQPLMLRVSTGMPEMYVYDGTSGNPVALINSDGHRAFAKEFDPYGTSTISSDSEQDPGIAQNPFSFSQGIEDRTTGWIHFGNRYMDPTTGTWTQMDTLDSPLDPKNANRYAYAGDDPINNIDPLGRLSAHCWLGILVGLAGFFAQNDAFNKFVVTQLAAPETGGISELLVPFEVVEYIGGSTAFWAGVGIVIRNC